MALNFFNEQGTPLQNQTFNWRELVQKPISKLDDNAFTRIRIILLNGIELEALRFSHVFSRNHRELQLPLAKIRQIEQHQATMINWLLGADHSPLETTIGYEQVAIEVTASIARKEPDPYLSQVYRFGLLEDFDHLYRYSALMDRIEGKDANNILQSYTDILPGRPLEEEHRVPEDEIRNCYNRKQASTLTKLHALTLVGGEYQTHDYYMNIGPTFTDPTARQLYAEIASIEEQHVTQYESIIDPTETWMEKWLLHEANEVYNYYSCVESESNPQVKAIWERFLDYELGHLQVAMEYFKKIENRDPAEILSENAPNPIQYVSNREYVRNVLINEANLRTNGPNFVSKDQEGPLSIEYRKQMNSQGSPSRIAAAGYIWTPGGELTQQSDLSKEAAA